MNYDNLKQFFFKFDPETAHKIAETAMRSSCLFPGILSFVANKFTYTDSSLKQEIFGLNFINPISLGGGFDKNATMIAPLTALGFGYLEFGTFTPQPQVGNEKPRLFRLIEEESIQNAMGFNNDGSDKIKDRVEKIYPFAIPLVANIGKNKNTINENAIKDYEILLREFKNLCDIFVVNISSPNTPNLRNLQEACFINEFFSMATNITNKPIILKIAPDMEEKQAINLSQNAVNAGASGIIINNTSIDYSLIQNRRNFGGLSGKLIRQKSRKMFKAVADELFGSTVLISCGGIDSAKEAYLRIKMGASLIQIYTAFIFKGPSICKEINQGLAELLRQDGFSNIKEAIGVDVKKDINASKI